jgi:excisionase family DNA binding protein
MITYTALEVAHIFRVTVKTIYNWVEAGTLPAIRTSKKSGSKLLFAAEDVHALLTPQFQDLRRQANKALAAGLAGLFVRLSNGETDMIMGVEQDPNSHINVLTQHHGWFALSGHSVAAGTAKELSILGYYVDPRHAE